MSRTLPKRDRQPKLRTTVAIHSGAVLLLLLFTLALYARLLFTNRILASGDILYYFYPYRDYAAAAFRNGAIPFWNPYIFMGVPFLANPQAAALYPLHWPLSWLSVTRQIYWSAALHTWLLGVGGYFLLRYWGYGAVAALITGLVLAGSGFVGGLIGHINQLNGAAWLPWLVLTLEQGWPRAQDRTELPGTAVGWPRIALGAAFFGLIVALMLLAGHTQTVYINLFGLGVWLAWPLVTWETVRRPAAALRGIAPLLAIYAGGLLLGLLLAAPQLLPTLELSRLGLRSGGLNYGEASSFSLQPLRLFWTLLPSYGLVDLGVLFDTSGYTEFVAYVGMIGLLLALAGAWWGRGRAHAFGLLFALLGLFLAAGRWNPFYFVLYKLVPGFDLFRAPARWMMLYTVGMAVLAGIGGAQLLRRMSGRKPMPATAVLLLLMLGAELLLAARALPHTHTTAPEAVYGVRTAPAHLLTDPERALHPAAAGRFLSMSSLIFDPGDMVDYRRIFVEGEDPTLDEPAFAQLVVAQKAQEILAPNLSLFWRVPAVDGFDGGVLPLQRYLRTLALFIPPEELVPDGRLREQIDQIPPADLLALFNIEYIITDKTRDLWYDGVYYDRQIGARLDAATPTTRIDVPTPFAATHVDVIGYVAGPEALLIASAQPVARITVSSRQQGSEELELTGGGLPGANFADSALDSELAAQSGAEVAYRDEEGGRQAYRARLALDTPLTPDALVVEALAEDVDVVLQAVTLFDERTGMFAALLPSDQGDFALVHSGDVKIYTNEDVAPRARLVHDWATAASADAALAYVREQGGEALARPVVEGRLPENFMPLADRGTGEATLAAYAPERVEIRTTADADGLLLLADAYYPGWRATVDGEEATIYVANYLQRAVPVPAGKHTVVMTYRASGWRFGLAAAGVGASVLLVLVLSGWAGLQRRGGRFESGSGHHV